MSSISKPRRPSVGVGVAVLKDGKYLLGKRKGSHGAGTWCFPGGHLEWGEDIAACAMRETQEEAGITVTNLRPSIFTNDFNAPESTHYVTLYYQADYASGQVTICEPEKCEQWGWFAPGEFPTPLFLSTRHYAEAMGLV